MKRSISPLIVLLILCNTNLHAQFKTVAESDPIKPGWITGSPPAPDRILRFKDGSTAEH